MTLSVSIIALLLGFFAPPQQAPAPQPAAKFPAEIAAPAEPEALPAEARPVQTAAAPTCILSRGSDRRLVASVDAPAAGFTGAARLQLSGTGFRQDDTRPLRLDGSESVSPWARVSVPMPRDLQGDLTILNTRGETVCSARL